MQIFITVVYIANRLPLKYFRFPHKFSDYTCVYCTGIIKKSIYPGYSKPRLCPYAFDPYNTLDDCIVNN